MSIRDKWVRRFSIDETSRHKNGFTIYKITSVLFPLESPEAVTVVSVWKRYSDIQQLHKSMKSLHAGLHLRGTFPTLAKSSFFKRFQQEVIEERAKSIKELLEFIAEHRLLFTSTDFVNFLQDGYPEPEPQSGVINAIRSSLQLPVEHTPPLEYQSDDDSSLNVQNAQEVPSESATDFDISQIPIYEATEVEIRESPKDCTRSGTSDSFESINSLESLDSDFYDELKRIRVKPITSIKRNLPDLIDFERPSTSVSRDVTDCAPRVTTDNSTSDKGVEGGYAVEAGYLLSVAGRCEDAGDYERAFEFYKTGIEKLLQGVQSETDESRRSLLKQKANKYLSHAERVYNEQLSHSTHEMPPLVNTGALPSSLLAREAAALGEYRVLAVLADRHMLVTDSHHKCYTMKVIPKVPRNLTELDTYLGTGQDTYTPILPTVVPYMVPLQAHITTEDRIFLVLTYAPGERLTDYIRNYVRSHPNTPKNDVNSPKKDVNSPKSGYPYSPKKSAIDRGEYPLSPIAPDCTNLQSPKKDMPLYSPSTEGIHNSPKKVGSVRNSPKKDIHVPIISDDQNNIHISDVIESKISTGIDSNNFSNVLIDSKVITGIDSNKNITTPDDISEIVLNSQRLLMNVDKALSQARVAEENKENVTTVTEKVEPKAEDTTDSLDNDVQVRPCAVLGGALRRWAAQVLTALSALHAAGARCGDLRARNVLLHSGAAVLTYTPAWPHTHVLGREHKGGLSPCVAPELRGPLACDLRVADYWSYGAVLYELFLGEPLRACDVWWGRTCVPIPPGLDPHMHDLLERLLAMDPSERLGANGPDEIREHPYFRGIDWQALLDAWLVPE
ncbi:ribosomal protein S6 kinase delta-1 isoform X2 [Aricia agestis]|uniref:ribosomal protein S6 kinase delta-1 isoform X2 n=1 Tax=Aricia agestis TaxID=91739 RepID=UPI001C206711|nr:ribosomal protein S6 kinase delta-1 isoform X2 [Aricia agestis]